MEHNIWFNPRETEQRQINVSAEAQTFNFLFIGGCRLNVNKSDSTAHGAQRFKISTILKKRLQTIASY